MRKYLLLIVAFLFVATPAFSASGEVYLGKYLPGTEWASDPDNQTGADWRAGVYLEQDFGWFKPFGEIETTIDKSLQPKYIFHPSSVLYKIGADIPLIDTLTLRLEHGCWHHIDSVGENQQYNRAELRWGFGGD